MNSVRAISINAQNVGKHVKTSKKKFEWKFSINGQEYIIELFASFLSGKKKITQNGKKLYQEQKMSLNFQYSFNIGHNMLLIVQNNDTYELRINNQSFSYLYGQERTKQEFSYEGNQKSSGWEKEEYKPKKPTIDYKSSSNQQSVSSYKPEKIDKKEGGFGFDHGFDKFSKVEYGGVQKSNNPKNEFANFAEFSKVDQKKPSFSQNNDFGNFNNFGDFAKFDNVEKKQEKFSPPKNAFDNFGNNFGSQPNSIEKAEKAKKEEMNLLDMMDDDQENNYTPDQINQNQQPRDLMDNDPVINSFIPQQQPMNSFIPPQQPPIQSIYQNQIPNQNIAQSSIYQNQNQIPNQNYINQSNFNALPNTNQSLINNPFNQFGQSQPQAQPQAQPQKMNRIDLLDQAFTMSPILPMNNMMQSNMMAQQNMYPNPNMMNPQMMMNQNLNQVPPQNYPMNQNPMNMQSYNPNPVSNNPQNNFNMPQQNFNPLTSNINYNQNQPNMYGKQDQNNSYNQSQSSNIGNIAAMNAPAKTPFDDLTDLI